MDDLKSASQLDDLPHKWVDVVVDYLRGFRNDTTDFNRPQLRPSVRHTYPAFVCGYSALIMAGALCNAYVLAIVARKRLYAADPVYVYVANLAVTGIVECVSVLPISLMVLLVQNWIFGRFLCFFLPMLQGWKDEDRNETNDIHIESTEGGLMYVWKAIQTFISPDPRTPEIKNSITNATKSMINLNHNDNNNSNINITINNYYNCNHTP